MRRVFSVAATAAVTAALLHAAPASADEVVVRGLGFAAGSQASLVITGCPGIFDRSAEPIATYLSNREGAPAGTRSLKYDLAGGNAVGPRYTTSSMASASVAGLSLYAAGGSSGVAYAGYRAPADAATDLVWVGRAALSQGGGGWRAVDAAGLTYTWTKYDLSTQKPVGSAQAPATVSAFMAANGGDGPGFYTVGFGCDGKPFKIDALRFGGTTYDLEGYTSSTQISGSRALIDAGDEITLRGVLRDGAGRSLPHGLLILEQRSGGGAFTPVEGAARTVNKGDPSVTVQPEGRTEYRWRFAGTSSVDGSISATFSVNVSTVVTSRIDDSGRAAAPAEPTEAAEPTGGSAPTEGAEGVEPTEKAEAVQEAPRPRIAVTGTVTPARAGLKVTVWRATAKQPVAVGSAQLGKDGTYRVELPPEADHTWRYFVTVPAVGGNLAGRTQVQQVQLTR